MWKFSGKEPKKDMSFRDEILTRLSRLNYKNPPVPELLALKADLFALEFEKNPDALTDDLLKAEMQGFIKTESEIQAEKQKEKETVYKKIEKEQPLTKAEKFRKQLIDSFPKNKVQRKTGGKFENW